MFCGEQKYVALKVQKSAQHYTEAAIDEIAILKQIAHGDPDNMKAVVKLLDHFKHSGPNGHHVCMVFEFLGDNLLTFIKRYDYRGLPLYMVREISREMLIGLDYLHRQLSIIHTDLKPENVLLVNPLDPSKDPRRTGFVPIFEKAGETAPASSGGVEGKGLSKNQKKKLKRRAKKANGNGVKGAEEDHTGNVSTRNGHMDSEGPVLSDSLKIEYKLRRVSGVSGDVAEVRDGSTDDKAAPASCDVDGHVNGQNSEGIDLRCKIVDLGNACWTYKQFTSDIQTRQYRCPEVLLGSKYSTSADMWSFACIVFELATGDVLFDPRSGDGFDRNEVSLAV